MQIVRHALRVFPLTCVDLIDGFLSVHMSVFANCLSDVESAAATKFIVPIVVVSVLQRKKGIGGRRRRIGGDVLAGAQHTGLCNRATLASLLALLLLAQE